MSIASAQQEQAVKNSIVIVFSKRKYVSPVWTQTTSSFTPLQSHTFSLYNMQVTPSLHADQIGIEYANLYSEISIFCLVETLWHNYRKSATIVPHTFTGKAWQCGSLTWKWKLNVSFVIKSEFIHNSSTNNLWRHLWTVISLLAGSRPQFFISSWWPFPSPF